MINPIFPARDWRELYLVANLEVDPVKLTQRINDARVAIMERLETTLAKPGSGEHQEMYDALNGLRVLCQECEDQMRKTLQKNLENRCLEVRRENEAAGS